MTNFWSAGSEAEASNMSRVIGRFDVILSYGLVAHAVSEKLAG